MMTIVNIEQDKGKTHRPIDKKLPTNLEPSNPQEEIICSAEFAEGCKPIMKSDVACTNREEEDSAATN